MKFKVQSFRAKLWRYFALFVIIIFGMLWLLQTVFLQSFYNGMRIKNIKKSAEIIADERENPELERVVDQLTYDNSLLVFLTDPEGRLLYSSDEYSYVYEDSKGRYQQEYAEDDTPKQTEKEYAPEQTEEYAPEHGVDNPYRNRSAYTGGSALDKSGNALDKSGSALDKSGNALDKSGSALDKSGNALDKSGNALDKSGNALDKSSSASNSSQLLSWQVGAFRNLPQDYSLFLQTLYKSENGSVGYQIEGRGTYVYGLRLPASDPAVNVLGSQESVLYISASLEAVGATVSILRMQLIWVTAASLVIGFILAVFAARRFSRPVSAICTQARHMTDAEDPSCFQKGFCCELDELSDTLLQTAAELKRAENYRRELLANVSHDLRTPLTMIKGYAEMIRDISWTEPEQREEDLAVIIRETHRLNGLVNEILDYSALQKAGRTVELETVDMSALTQEVIRQFTPLCGRDHYEVKASIEMGQLVSGDKKQLSRVLYNLIDNAIRHSGDSRSIQVVLADLGTVVRIEVRDSGKGISQEELPHIWDRYFTSKKRNQKGDGSGLGLAIAKEILLIHRAEFGVESELGKGSVFWFQMEKVSCQ